MNDTGILYAQKVAKLRYVENFSHGQMNLICFRKIQDRGFSRPQQRAHFFYLRRIFYGQIVPYGRHR